MAIGSQSDLVESTDSLGKKSYSYTDSMYFLSPHVVELWSEYGETPDKIWLFDDETLPITSFYDPEKIIINLVDKLYEKANKNKVVFDKLQIMKNILELSGLSK